VQLQDSQLPDKLRVSEAPDLYASSYRRPARADELLTRLGPADRRDALFGTLSGGQTRRVSVALAPSSAVPPDPGPDPVDCRQRRHLDAVSSARLVS